MRLLKTGTLSRCLLVSFAVIFAAVLSGSCGGGGSSSGSAPQPTPLPNISVAPLQTDFGVVVLGKTADKQITVSNAGPGDLTIETIAEANAGSPFSITNDGCSGQVVAPSSSCTVTVRFAPTVQGDYSNSFDIPSNDTEAGTLTASLAGKGRALNVSIVGVSNDGQTVQVVVSVSDQDGNPVINLAPGDFSIKEDGSSTNIDNVSNIGAPASISVGMALDISESMYALTDNVDTAAKDFIDTLDLANSDEAEIVKFDNTVHIMQAFTQDNVALKNAIDNNDFPYAVGTVLYDAIRTTLDNTVSQTNERRAIIVVSDFQNTWEAGGLADNNAPVPADLIAAAADNNVQIYTIGIGDNINTEVMQALAQGTGGQYFLDPNAEDLDLIYSAISQTLTNQYTIEYTASAGAGSTISLDVLVNDGGDLGETSKTVTLTP